MQSDHHAHCPPGCPPLSRALSSVVHVRDIAEAVARLMGATLDSMSKAAEEFDRVALFGGTMMQKHIAGSIALELRTEVRRLHGTVLRH